MNKTVLHIIDSLETGGAETLLVGVVNSMEDYNHIIVTLLQVNDYKKKLKGTKVVSLNYKNKLNTISCIRTIKGIIDIYHPDVIHCHLLTATFLGRMAKPKNLPLFFTVHNTLSQGAFETSLLSKSIESKSYNASHTAIFVSNTVKIDYEKAIGIRGQSHVLYNYIEPVYFSNQKKQFEINTKVRLIAVGSLKPQKNYSFLIESLSKWGAKNFILDIYGDGPLKSELQKQIAYYGLEKSISLKGTVSNIPERICDYDIYILASTFEGYGLSPIEAMAAGIPTLLSDIEVLREVSNGNSLFFDPRDSKDFIVKLEHYISNPNLRKSKSLDGKMRAQFIGNKEAHMNDLRKIYLSQCQ